MARAGQVQSFYDQLAANYHLIFEDWEASMRRQEAALDALLKRECPASSPLRLLDCACGIGTQALGLAQRGHRVTACDFSAAAVERLRREADARAVEIRSFVADMLDLDSVPEDGFDAVLCLDNALPHLDSDEALLQAVTSMGRKLRPGGTLVASIRDYDSLVLERPAVQGPALYGDQGRRRIVHQLWDWIDERRYVLHLYITRETEGGWDAQHYVSTYRAVLRAELAGVVERAGFAASRWLFPDESGFYQPVLLAKTGDRRNVP